MIKNMLFDRERSEFTVTEKATTRKAVVVVKIFTTLKQTSFFALEHWERCLGGKTSPTEGSLL